MSLTHLRRANASITTLWTGLFQIAECLISFLITILLGIPVPNTNNITLIKRRVLQRLI